MQENEIKVVKLSILEGEEYDIIEFPEQTTFNEENMQIVVEEEVE